MARSVLLFGLLLAHFADAYDLVKTYSGNTFFDDWNFIYDWDHWTGGDVQYQNTTGGANLTSVNEAGNVILRVDSWTDIRLAQYEEKRNSVRIEGKQIFNNTNAVVMFDVAHVPTGCSVWGSLWSKSGIQQWPKGGEVDIFEAVNRMSANQMALHTAQTCTIPNPNPNASGQTLLTDCTVTTNPDGTHGNGSGCVVSDPQPESYSSFASSSGGVWVAEYAPTAVNIWFFTRPSVPSGLTTAATIDTATLGKPTANFPTSDTCDIAGSLDPQHLVIDITLCGNWAGEVIADTCGALTATNCYQQYVKDPANYVDAYFEIASVKIFGGETTLLENGTIPITTPTRSSATIRPSSTNTRSLIAPTIGDSTSTSTTTRPNDAHKQMVWSAGGLALASALTAALL